MNTVLVHGGFLPGEPWQRQPAEVVTRIQVVDRDGRPGEAVRRARRPGLGRPLERPAVRHLRAHPPIRDLQAEVVGRHRHRLRHGRVPDGLHPARRSDSSRSRPARPIIPDSHGMTPPSSPSASSRRSQREPGSPFAGLLVLRKAGARRPPPTATPSSASSSATGPARSPARSSATTRPSSPSRPGRRGCGRAGRGQRSSTTRAGSRPASAGRGPADRPSSPRPASWRTWSRPAGGPRRARGRIPGLHRRHRPARAARRPCRRVFEDIGDAFKTSPAAICDAPRLPARPARTHRPHGAGGPGAAASVPEVDADLALAGVLLHDIGKTIEYEGALATSAAARASSRVTSCSATRLVRRPD